MLTVLDIVRFPDLLMGQIEGSSLDDPFYVSSLRLIAAMKGTTMIIRPYYNKMKTESSFAFISSPVSIWANALSASALGISLFRSTNKGRVANSHNTRKKPALRNP